MRRKKKRGPIPIDTEETKSVVFPRFCASFCNPDEGKQRDGWMDQHSPSFPSDKTPRVNKSGIVIRISFSVPSFLLRFLGFFPYLRFFPPLISEAENVAGIAGAEIFLPLLCSLLPLTRLGYIGGSSRRHSLHFSAVPPLPPDLIERRLTACFPN